MATHAGKEGTVKVGANEIAEIRDWSITETGETTDDTSMGDRARTHIATVSSWEASISSWWDETDTNGQGALTINASVTLNLYPEGSTGGDTFYSGTATVTGITRNAALDGMVEVAFTCLGSGTLTEATV